MKKVSDVFKHLEGGGNVKDRAGVRWSIEDASAFIEDLISFPDAYTMVEAPVTKEEVIEELKRLSEIDDLESTHLAADDILLRYIDDKEIEDAYNDIEKWYS